MIFGKHINRYYLRYAPLLILGAAALVCVDYFQLIIPNLYGMLIDGINEGSVLYKGAVVPFNMDFLLDKICLPIVGIVVVMIVGRFLWRVCFFGSAIRVETNIRIEMFDHCKDLSRDYYQVNKVGNLMSLFTNDLDTIQECFGDGMLMFFDALFLGILGFYNMWRMDHVMTLLTLIPLGLILLIGTLMGKAMMKQWEVRQRAFSSLSDFSQESFSGFAVIKAFVKELKQLMAFRKLNIENEKANVDYVKISNLMHVLIVLLVETVICVILGYGGYLVHEGVFSAGRLVEYIGYFSSVVWPVMAVSMLIEKTARGKASMKRVSELLEAEITVKDEPGAVDIGKVEGRIEFRDLTFRYPDGEFDALEHVSFTIEAGESVGIVGKTGSGKTTIVDLILRTYNVPKGTLFVDGHDVTDITIKSLREGCAYVPQDNFLFSDTIANNINFAYDELNEKAVEDSARLAAVHGNIAEFRDKYETVLGERGVTVSGGQKQRISIARALMKDAPILILDDSVSAVDTDTEKVILGNLKETRKGKTTILIAHRISTIKELDKIVFVEDGRVTAVGSHDELLGTCREYARMVELQRLEEEAAR
ncbi:MAG: ABC transporter ATP-binding protein/permease [Clostridiales bacterium]|nr:ABC transporter ATP-binding protein/permease [Clostridiales bacterium]